MITVILRRSLAFYCFPRHESYERAMQMPALPPVGSTIRLDDGCYGEAEVTGVVFDARKGRDCIIQVSLKDVVYDPDEEPPVGEPERRWRDYTDGWTEYDPRER